MTECPLYNDPQLYDLLFPVSKESSAVLDEARRQRILASERFYLVEAEKGGRDVLEIACGSGRLAIPLAEHGFEVTGLDLSGAMIAFAKEKASAAGVRLRLLEADMRSFILPERFSTILIPGNSLLHLVAVEDLLQCLRNVRQHLRTDCRLIFDVATPDVRVLARGSDEYAPAFQFHDPQRGQVSVDERTKYDAATQVCDYSWRFSTVDAPSYQVLDYQLRILFPQELLLLLDAAGFRLDARFGGFSREDFGSSSSRQVCICSAK